MARTSLRTRIRNATPGPGAADPATPAPAPRRRRLADDARITWLRDDNPMTPGRKNYDRYAARMGCGTVGEALKAGSSIGDIVYDHEHRYIEVEGLPPVPAPASE